MSGGLGLGRGAEYVRAQVVAGDAGRGLNSQYVPCWNRPITRDPLIHGLRRHTKQPSDASLTSPMFLNSDGDCVHGVTKASL